MKKVGNAPNGTLSKNDFITKDANLSVITPGHKNGKTNYSYLIELISKKKDAITFDSIWVDGNRLKLMTTRSSTVTDSTISLQKGDIISLKANLAIQNEIPVNRQLQPKNDKESNVDSPIKFEGAALIRFYKEGNKYYYPISIITKKRINLP